jgi:tRNA-Thr(GGU) m(6)t(6)A37 methyltransferase TsaA
MSEIKPIGIIETPFTELEGMPIQPAGAVGAKGQVVVFEEYAAGLKDLDGFSHIFLLYLFHKSRGYNLLVKPYLDSVQRGLFATRAPKRPNPIGISLVRLDSIEANLLRVSNVDILNGTPLLDIKPYVPDFDAQEDAIIGWLEQAKSQVARKKSDNRFK